MEQQTTVIQGWYYQARYYLSYVHQIRGVPMILRGDRGTEIHMWLLYNAFFVETWDAFMQWKWQFQVRAVSFKSKKWGLVVILRKSETDWCIKFFKDLVTLILFRFIVLSTVSLLWIRQSCKALEFTQNTPLA